MNNEKLKKIYRELYKIAEAGEKGYATAAVNVQSLELKILFKYFAQLRARDKSEIKAELQSLKEDSTPRSSIPGMIHRGRINIFVFMLVDEKDREKTVLKEIVLGEKIAQKAYQRALKQDLPSRSCAMIAPQLEEIKRNTDIVNQLMAQDNPHKVVQLVDLESNPKIVIQLPEKSETTPPAIQEIYLREVELYSGHGATVAETILSGAFGGALWGGLLGILAGFGVVQTAVPAPVGLGPTLSLWIIGALTLMVVGAFISTGLAIFIGLGVSEEGSHPIRDWETKFRTYSPPVAEQPVIRK